MHLHGVLAQKRMSAIMHFITVVHVCTPLSRILLTKQRLFLQKVLLDNAKDLAVITL